MRNGEAARRLRLCKTTAQPTALGRSGPKHTGTANTHRPIEVLICGISYRQHLRHLPFSTCPVRCNHRVSIESPALCSGIHSIRYVVPSVSPTVRGNEPERLWKRRCWPQDLGTFHRKPSLTPLKGKRFQCSPPQVVPREGTSRRRSEGEGSTRHQFQRRRIRHDPPQHDSLQNLGK